MRLEIYFGESKIVVIGTGHVFKRSIMEVKTTISKEKPDIVCVELDVERYKALIDGKRASFIELVRARGLKTAIFGSVLSAIQNEVGEDYGVMPGTDMLTAIECARKERSRVFFIDRNVNITVNRLVNEMTFWEKIKTMAGAFLSLTPLKREVSVSQFDQSFINEILSDFKKFSPNAYRVMIEERDKYMFERINAIVRDEVKPICMVVVIGAGHIRGIVSMLEAAKNDYEREKTRDLEKNESGEGDGHNWKIWSN